MIRVAVVDDHPVVLDGVAANLADADGIAVVGTARDLAGAVALVRRERPDVIVLDVELPDGSGLDAIGAIRDASSATRIVVFTAYGGEDRVSTALARGAESYVLKGTASEELIATVRAAADGTSQLAPEVASQLVASLRAPRAIRLTPREREILKLVADGLSNRAIGARLGISERTAKYHVGEILGRLGAENRAQAVSIASRRGLV